MSFFMGLATGLAKSVDTQLKESIERTRDNIDMVSKWRLKKAEEREKERRSKDKEIEKMIKDAAYVISGDQNNVNAQNIAASLYQERGLSGFNDDIEFMRQQSKTGVRPIDFIQRASVDTPSNKFGLSEIVRSLSDAESSYAPSDMIFPKGTIKGSGLISAIAPGFDVTAAGGEQATQQMKQIGLTTTPIAPSLSFDRYTFDRESLGYATKSVNEKLSYLRNIIDDPTADPDLAAKAGERLNELLNRSMTGEESSAIQAINLKLSRLSTQDTSAMSMLQFQAFDSERDSLIKRRQSLEDTIALRDAKTVAERLAIEADIAFRNDRPEEGFALLNKAEDLGGKTTNTVLINRIKARSSRLQGNEDYMNSTGDYVRDGFKEDRARIQVIQANEQSLSGPASFDKVQALSTQIRATALAEFKAQHPDLYKDMNVSLGEKEFDAESFIAAIQGAGADASEKYNNILTSVAQRYKTVALNHNVAEDTIDNAIMLLTGKGLPAVSDGDTAGTGDGSAGTQAQTEAAFQANVDATDRDEQLQQAETLEQLDEAQIKEIESQYPNSEDGATALISSLAKNNRSISEIVSAVPEIHDGSFTSIVAQKASELENEIETVVEETASSNPLTPQKNLFIPPPKLTQAAKAVAANNGIDVQAAENLMRQRLDELNAPIEMEPSDATYDNVLKVLDKEGLLITAGLFGKAGVAPARREKAIQKIREAFSLSTTDARDILNETLTDYSSRTENQPFFYRSDDKKEPFLTMGEVDFSLRNLLNDAFKDIPEVDADPEQAEFKINPIQLANKYIDGDLTDPEKEIFREALEGPNGNKLAVAIDMIKQRQKAEKEVSAYKSRGGLMGK